MRKNILALDFGGTKLASAVIDITTGEILTYSRESVGRGWTAKESVSMAIKIAKNNIFELGNCHIDGIGISFGGPVNLEGTKILKSQHVRGWVNYPLRKIIGDEFKLPVFIGNDANLAALGEWKFGAGKNAKVLFYVQISTGIGSGIIMDGEIFKGNGLAGEFGHVTIKNGGLTCACGKKGCLESYSAGWAISKIGKEEYHDLSKHKIMQELSKDNLDNIDAELIFEAYRRNDIIAKKIISSSMESLGIALSHAICFFDPDLIVLGGGISKSEKIIKEELFPVIHSNTPPDFKNRYKIKFSKLNGKEALLGAALIAK